MKKLIYIASFLFTSFIFAQGGPKVDVIKFRGEVTTTVRNTFDVPTGERWLIWNVTTSQFEHAGSDDVWTSLVSGTGDVTAANPFGTDNRLIKSDGTGKGVQSTGITIDDSNNINLGGAEIQNGGESDFTVISASTGLFAPVLTDAQEVSYSKGRIWYNDTDNEWRASNDTNDGFIVLSADGTGTDDQTASEVTITDSGDNFTATDVEGALAELATSGGSGTDDQNANEVPYDNSTSGLTATDVQAAIDEVVASGGGSATYSPPVINSLNGDADFTAGNANIHSGANPVINQLSAAETIKIALSNANAGEVDVYRFDLNNASGQLDFTSTNGFVANGFTGNAVRLDGIGEVDFIETGANTGVFKVLPGSNVSYVTLDLTPPSISGSPVVENADPDAVVITYTEALNASFVPATTQYTINDPSANAVTSVNISGSTVTLGLTNPIENGDTVTLGYSSSGIALRDLAGNLAGSVSSVSVTNNVEPACTPDPNEIFTTANAASDPNCNEVDGVAGINVFGSVTLTTSTDANVGTHSLRAEQTAAGTHFIWIDLPDTGSYTLTYDIKQLVGTGGSTAAISVSGGVGTTVTSSWTSHTQTLTATGGASFRFNPGGDGNVILVNNISLIPN